MAWRTRQVLLSVALLAAGLVALAGAVTDEEIDRPLVLRAGERCLRPAAHAPLRPEGRPDEFQPREFPNVLWDPARPPGPDGVLWRRWRADDPNFDARASLTPSPDALRRRFATQRVAPDTVRVLLLRVDFRNDGAGSQSTTADGRFDLRNGDSLGLIVDPPPHNQRYFDSHMRALQRYYWKQSGGQLRLEWDIYPAEEDSAYHLNDTQNYGPWLVANDAEILALAERFVRDAFALADTSDAAPDFRRYDSFILFHAGTDLQGDINRDTPYDIPSFNLFLAEPVAVQDSTFFLDLIMVMPETASQDGYTAAINGVVAHEFGHQLGFFDLYNVLDFSPMVGMFSLMDSGEQLYGTVAADSTGEEVIFVRGAIPASLDPWHKLLFFGGGVRSQWATHNGRVTLPAVQTDNELALVPIGGQWLEYLDQLPEWWAPWYASEYYILENRPYDLNGDGSVILETDPETGVFQGPGNLAPEDVRRAEPDTLGAYEQDYLLPGSGILIWHIDNAAIQAMGNICSGCINISRERRGVALEEADGIQDLGDIYSVEWTGGAFDYWQQGGYSVFGPDTRPGTRSGAGGATGIQVLVVDSAAVEMVASVRLGFTRAGWPIYVGDPLSDESIVITDADGEGTLDILVAGGRDVLDRYGRELLAFWPDGQAYPFADGTGHFALSDSTLLPGVATAPGFVNAGGVTAPLIAAASGTRVYAWDPFGNEKLRYPGSAEIYPLLRFTTPPMLLDSVLVVGDSEGRMRGLLPGAANELLWRTSPDGPAVTTTAAGDLYGDGTPVLAWGDRLGWVHVATGAERSGYVRAAGWPQRIGSSGEPIVSLLLVEAPLAEAGSLFALDAAGQLARLTADGSMSAGWPRALAEAPAGPPVVGDPDGDGCLELVVTGESGLVHCFEMLGNEEAHWPHSVWDPDVTPFSRVRSGPVIADVNGDARGDILQGSGDGTLHAWTADAVALPGWPVAAGYPILAGPYVAQLGEQGALQLLAVDAMGFATILDLALPAHTEGPGEMWHSAGDPARTHAYARARLPQSSPVAMLLDEESVVFAPNPVRGETGRLRFRMGLSGKLRLALFDTSGQRVWQGERTPDSVAEETIWDLDLGDLAPGLYVGRITAEGGGDTLHLLRKLAIVR